MSIWTLLTYLGAAALTVLGATLLTLVVLIAGGVIRSAFISISAAVRKQKRESND